MDTRFLINTFQSLYPQNQHQPRLFFSPGRVNLIGEHTDYNGGHVFPCALSFGTYLAVAPNGSQSIRLATTNFEFRHETALDEIGKKVGEEWVNYPLGVIHELLQAGYGLNGADFLFSGDIPNKSGLSSSASIELVTGVACNELFNLRIERVNLVKIGQRAENRFVGVNCGIMDQFAVGMGQKDRAIFLNCDTLDYELVPARLDGYKLVIANTNKERGLADSKYNERVAECQTAVSLLSTGTPITHLAELSSREFAEYEHLILDETIKRRARHVVSENERVLQAVNELKKGSLEAFGALMNASHDSLRDDYEVTGPELDTLVDEARKVPGVLGSRMTGAGFGGCTVSLVKEEQVNDMIKAVSRGYYEKTRLTADFYVADIGDGAGPLKP